MLRRIPEMKIFIITLVTGLLIACDSTDNVPIQKVDSTETISEDSLNEMQSSASQEDDVYYFGFDLRQSPQEDAAEYIPFLNYLSNETGLKFKLHFTPKDSTSADELGLNYSQLAAMGATSYLYARERYGAKSVVRGMNTMGKAEYQSMFVALPESEIESITDIKGKRLAFGNINSTQGHLIPRVMLNKVGINLVDLGSYIYTGSHQNCAEAIVAGLADVCGMQDQLAKTLADDGTLKIIHTSEFYPSSGITINKTVPNEVVEKIKQAMLRFDPEGIHKEGLYNWHLTEMPGGFIAAQDTDYQSLYEWSVKLGFLKEQ